jgi:hypothetical protein
MSEHPGALSAAAFSAPADVDRLQTKALVVAGLGAVACGIGFFLSPQYFFRAYLVGWVYWVGVALGCTAVMMLHHMTRGAWGLVIRRVLEAASRTLPWMLLLSLPLFFFGLDDLYSWARPEVVAGDHLLQVKQPYLNATFFFVRLAIYFLLWYGFAWVLNRMSLRQDAAAPDPVLTRRMQLIAGPGLAAYCLAVTFASVDWLMSIDAHWFSTLYGVYLMGSQGLSALGFLIAFGLWLSRRKPMDSILQSRHFHDWGKLFFAFVMLWAYFSFSQFLIIWAGNLPEEISWYLDRTRHGWQFVALSLGAFHFALPFVLLLSRDLKRNAKRLAGVALLMLVMRLVDVLWQVEPGFALQSPGFYWLYPAATAAIGGLWLYLFLRELKKRPLLPVNDPYLPEAIAHEHH